MRRVLVACGIAVLAGCGGSERPSAGKPRPTTETVVVVTNQESDPVTTIPTGGEGEYPEQGSTQEAAQSRQVARLRVYLRDNFSETTWYPAIERIELAPYLTVHTTLYREYEPAQAICNAVRFSGVFPDMPVRVFNRDGDRIMWTGDPGDQQPCDDD